MLLTAIMVAGRTGSAYAAELGVMKLNDEVDALESMGLNPYEVLVLPRIEALVLVMPLLTIVANAMGLAGGALLTSYLLDLPWSQFVLRLRLVDRRHDAVGVAGQGARVRPADRAARRDGQPSRIDGARIAITPLQVPISRARLDPQARTDVC